MSNQSNYNKKKVVKPETMAFFVGFGILFMIIAGLLIATALGD